MNVTEQHAPGCQPDSGYCAVDCPRYAAALSAITANVAIGVTDATIADDGQNDTTILEQAGDLVAGDRRDDYGHPLDDYTRVGAMWGAILHDWARAAAESPTPLPVPAELSILCMEAVKIGREVHQPKRDNRVDGAGYWYCLDLVHDERARRADQ